MEILKAVVKNPQVRRFAAEVGLSLAKEAVRALTKERALVVVKSAA